MRREQLGELVNLTSMLPAQPRTAEMPAVELRDLLRRDRELETIPAATPDHIDVVPDHEVTEVELDDTPFRGDLTGRTARRSALLLALGCVAAFAGGFALTTPLWW